MNMRHEVQFKEDDSNDTNVFRSRKLIGEPVVPSFAKKLVSWGIVKNYNTAKQMLFIVTAILLVITLFTSIFLTPRTPQVNTSLGPNNSSP